MIFVFSNTILYFLEMFIFIDTILFLYFLLYFLQK